jgi:hypothetical protein
MSPRTTPTKAPVPDTARSGREALACHAWPEAFELLSRADREGSLTCPDLEALAEAALRPIHPADAGRPSSGQPLRRSRRVGAFEPREATVKGVTAPVSISKVTWA